MSLRHNLVTHHFNTIRIIPGEPRQIILKGQIMADGTHKCCGRSWINGCACPPEPEIRDFIVTGSYATWSGDIGSFRYVIPALDESEAFDKARTRLETDKRRKYMGKLDMSASPA